MTMNDRMKVAVLVAATYLGACPATPDPPDDAFIVDINNAWRVHGEVGHIFALTSEPSGRVASAKIGGTEFLPVGSSRELDGMFENRTIHFTSTLDANVLEFTGEFLDEVTMHLTTDDKPNLVILDKDIGQ